MRTRVMTPQAGFEQQARKLEAEPKRVAGLTARYQFELAGDGGGVWTLDIAGGRATIEQTGDGDADVRIRMKAQDFVRMCNGELSGQVAFISRKLKVRGPLDLAMRLRYILG